MKRTIISILTLAITVGTALPYSDDGHMHVAKIAYDKLSPAKRGKLDALMALLKNGKAPYNAVSAACWPDDVKKMRGFTQTANWHFVNTPLGGGPLPKKANIFDGIKTNIAAYKAAAAAADTPANRLKQAQALAFLIHLAGDIHQPLHCSEPGHSTGGNDIAIANADPKANLHHFWDGTYGASFDKATGKVSVAPNAARPSSANDASFASRTAAVVAGHAPGAFWNSKPGNFQAWADESFAAAKTDAYGPLAVKGPPYAPVILTEAYVTNARDITDRRIAMAGYRLAKLLDGLMK